MKTCPVIVIGHVDHGKTSLVRALSGIDTDMLPEEKARGLSIITGFAYRQCGGAMIDLIDAPGHADFIRAMVSGAAGARCAVLVVAATEGVQAQTREHIQIIAALGIHAGIVAVTKSDLVPGAERAGHETGLRAVLAGTEFQEAPMIFCSSVTGEGLEDLDAALAGMAAASAPSGPPAAFLAIDRVFVAQGHGTIVTGTLLGGTLKPKDELVLASLGQTLTIRQIQVRGQDVSAAYNGERTALNLRGIATGGINPGDVVHMPGAYSASLNFDAAIRIHAGVGRSVRHMEEIRVLCGTAQATAVVRLIEGRQLGPGEAGFVQLRFAVPATAFAGQRAILRSLSPSQTLGGAVILDPVAPPVKAGKPLRLATLKAADRLDTPALAAALAAEHRGSASLKDVCRLARAPEAAVRAGLGQAFTEVADGTVAPTAVTDQVSNAYLARLAAYHAEQKLRPHAPRSEIQVPRAAPALNAYAEAKLAAEGKILLIGMHVALTAHKPSDHLTPDQEARMDNLSSHLKAEGLTPAGSKALIEGPVDIDLLGLLVLAGEVIRLSNISLKQTIYFHADAVSAAAQILKTRFPGEAAFTTGEARAALNTSRKHIVPLLEYFDTAGITRRRGDTRYIA